MKLYIVLFVLLIIVVLSATPPRPKIGLTYTTNVTTEDTVGLIYKEFWASHLEKDLYLSSTLYSNNLGTLEIYHYLEHIRYDIVSNYTNATCEVDNVDGSVLDHWTFWWLPFAKYVGQVNNTDVWQHTTFFLRNYTLHVSTTDADRPLFLITVDSWGSWVTATLQVFETWDTTAPASDLFDPPSICKK